MEYIDGSNMLFMLGTKCVGHCTSHELTYTASTKERLVKPPLSDTTGAGKWTEKSVDKLSISGSLEGLVFDTESEYSREDLLKAWKAGAPVTAKGFLRPDSDNPYLVCNVIITNVKETGKAGEDMTYSANFESTGAPSVFMPAAS